MSQRTCNIVPNVRLTNTGKSVYSFQTTVLPPQTNRPIHVILLKTEHIKQNKWAINVSYINLLKHRGIRITFGLPVREKNTEYVCSWIHWACIFVLKNILDWWNEGGVYGGATSIRKQERYRKKHFLSSFWFWEMVPENRNTELASSGGQVKERVRMSLSTAWRHRGEYRYSSTHSLSRH